MKYVGILYFVLKFIPEKKLSYMLKKKSNVYSVASSCPIYFASPKKKQHKNTPEVLSVACYKRPELGPTA